MLLLFSVIISMDIVFNVKLLLKYVATLIQLSLHLFTEHLVRKMATEKNPQIEPIVST